MRHYERSFATPLLAEAFIDGLTYLGYEDVDIDEPIYIRQTDTDGEEWVVSFYDLVDDDDEIIDGKPTWDEVIEVSQKNEIAKKENDDIAIMENEGGYSQIRHIPSEALISISGSKNKLPTPQPITRQEEEYEVLEVGHVKLNLVKKKANEDTTIEG